MTDLTRTLDALEFAHNFFEARAQMATPGSEGAGKLYECSKGCADAIALLKAQEPRVMTLEEVRGLPPFTPVYVEEIDDPDQGIHITEYINEYVIDEDNLAGAEPGPRIAFSHYRESPEDYGSYWRCWTARPSISQREATPWK